MRVGPLSCHTQARLLAPVKSLPQEIKTLNVYSCYIVNQGRVQISGLEWAAQGCKASAGHEWHTPNRGPT
jgi:hypothetical protein